MSERAPRPHWGPVHTEASGKVELWPQQFRDALDAAHAKGWQAARKAPPAPPADPDWSTPLTPERMAYLHDKHVGAPTQPTETCNVCGGVVLLTAPPATPAGEPAEEMSEEAKHLERAYQIFQKWSNDCFLDEKLALNHTRFLDLLFMERGAHAWSDEFFLSRTKSEPTALIFDSRHLTPEGSQRVATMLAEIVAEAEKDEAPWAEEIARRVENIDHCTNDHSPRWADLPVDLDDAKAELIAFIKGQSGRR